MEDLQPIKEKDNNKRTKEFLFKLCDYVVKQTDNGKTRLRIVEGDVCGDGFILKSVQYKNGNRDYIINNFGGKQSPLMLGNNINEFFDLFEKKVF